MGFKVNDVVTEEVEHEGHEGDEEDNDEGLGDGEVLAALGVGAQDEE